MPPTRFVCLSDTHGYSPSDAGFKLPPGDVLIHAGDLTNQGSMAELQRTIDWISKAEYETKIIVAGNHDITLDSSDQNAEAQKYLPGISSASPSIVFLTHQSALIRLTRPEGPRTAFNVFGSPYSPRMSETWAGFTYETDNHATRLWSEIPRDADVVVTHTPPHAHLDSRKAGPTGCKALSRALRLIRPCLAVCGHVHEDRGVERVGWASEPGVEDHVERCELPPPGSRKQSLVDLTGRRGRRLDNEAAGSHPFLLPSSDGLALSSADQESPACVSERWDEARRETCIVNAAVMASSWPHRAGKKFNPPIVIDIELPQVETVDLGGSKHGCDE